MKEETILTEMETLFLALSDKTRLRILNLMREGEVCVHYFTEVLKESQPKISRHLAYLRNAGIVSARRDGKWIHYHIETPANTFAVNILLDTLEWLESQPDMREDYRKLSDIFYSDEPFDLPEADIYTETNMRRNEKEELETFLL